LERGAPPGGDGWDPHRLPGPLKGPGAWRCALTTPPSRFVFVPRERALLVGPQAGPGWATMNLTRKRLRPPTGEYARDPGTTPEQVAEVARGPLRAGLAGASAWDLSPDPSWSGAPKPAPSPGSKGRETPRGGPSSASSRRARAGSFFLQHQGPWADPEVLEAPEGPP
jgi:hypothetical protein